MNEAQIPLGFSFSSRVIALLRQRGMTLKAIGAVLGVSESFLSRVANEHRSLTVRHLELLEARLGESLPLLLLQATPREEIPPDKRPMFDELVALFRDSFEFRRRLKVREPRRRKVGARSNGRRRPGAHRRATRTGGRSQLGTSRRRATTTREPTVRKGRVREPLRHSMKTPSA